MHGLECENTPKLFQLAIKYISLGSDEKAVKNDSDNKNSLDFIKCERLIQSSFKYDYGYDPYSLKYLHWYDFYNDLQNLSANEFGSCCILNRIVGILDIDTSKIKDSKERNKIIETQKFLRKKYCKEEKEKLNKKEKENVASLYKQLGLWKGGN